MFRKYPIFLQTKFSHLQLKTFHFFLIRPKRLTDSLHKRINTDNMIYGYCFFFFFLLYLIRSGIETDINMLVVTAPNVHSGEFIRLHNRLSIFTSRLCGYFQRRIILSLSSKSNFYSRTALFSSSSSQLSRSIEKS